MKVGPGVCEGGARGYVKVGPGVCEGGARGM